MYVYVCVRAREGAIAILKDIRMDKHSDPLIRACAGKDAANSHVCYPTQADA